MQKLKKILHVDDDEDIRTIAKITLELVGHFEVAQFATGPDAIEAAQAFSPQLFLLDVMMPEMSGEETWRRLSALPGLEHVPTVFMTAKAESQFSNSLMEQGALGVIIKPFDPITLCARIEEIWQSQIT